MKRTLKNKKYTDKKNMFNEKFIKRTLQLFIRFLKEEKIIGVFNRNFSMYLKKIDKAQYVKYCSSYSSYVFDAAYRNYYLKEDENIHRLFLDYAMTWDETEKGYDFWQNVNRKWKIYFSNNLRLIKLEINEK